MKDHKTIGEVSQLTGLSKRTLHYYDHIGLLRPSLRTKVYNGFRMYAKEDLLKLRQIIALKLFRFTLAQIKELLKPNVDLLVSLKKQLELLDKKVQNFSRTSKLLNMIINNYNINQNIFWEEILQQTEKHKNSKCFKKKSDN